MLVSNNVGMPVFPVSQVEILSKKAVCAVGLCENMIAPYMNDEENRFITIAASKLMLKRYLDILYKAGYTTLLSGLTEGVGIWSAVHYLNCKRFKKNNLISIMPFLRYSEHFSPENIAYLRIIERFSDLLVSINTDPLITDESFPELSYNRDLYMIENSSAVIILADGENDSSGIYKMTDHAREKGKSVFTIDLGSVYQIIEDSDMNISEIYSKVSRISFPVPKAGS